LYCICFEGLIVVQVERQQKLQIRTRLCSLSLSDECVDHLCNFIFREGDYNQQSSYLRCITKTRGQVFPYPS